MLNCNICNKEFKTERSLHIHVSRKEKISVSDYYYKFYPRFDAYSGEPILFKDKETYFASFFNSRNTLISYCKKHSEKSIYLMKEVITRRAKLKNLTKCPSTFEARTSILPSPALIESFGISYNNICKELSLTPVFDYSTNKLLFDKGEELLLVDTREQLPLDLNCKYINTKLDFGDYTSRSHYKGTFVERKSIADLCGTISSGFERFKAELMRAKEMNSYVIVMVEDTINNLLIGKDFPGQSKVTPEFISHRIRELIQEFDCVQFLFVKNREHMKNVIRKLFLLKQDIRRLDVQWAYDTNILK